MWSGPQGHAAAPCMASGWDESVLVGGHVASGGAGVNLVGSQVASSGHLAGLEAGHEEDGGGHLAGPEAGLVEAWKRGRASRCRNLWLRRERAHNSLKKNKPIDIYLISSCCCCSWINIITFVQDQQCIWPIILFWCHSFGKKPADVHSGKTPKTRGD